MTPLLGRFMLAATWANPLEHAADQLATGGQGVVGSNPAVPTVFPQVDGLHDAGRDPSEFDLRPSLDRGIWRHWATRTVNRDDLMAKIQSEPTSV